jgi:hypothetical protein
MKKHAIIGISNNSESSLCFSSYVTLLLSCSVSSSLNQSKMLSPFKIYEVGCWSGTSGKRACLAEFKLQCHQKIKTYHIEG